jgi:ADYC domain-containing protein
MRPTMTPCASRDGNAPSLCPPASRRPSPQGTASGFAPWQALKKSRSYLCVLGLLAAAACAPADEGNDNVGERSLESVSPNGLSFNGLSFNGLSFNGLSFNGLSFNGLSFNGLSFNGATLNGLSFNGLSFNGSELTGVDAGGVERQGAELVGVELQGTLSNGSTFPVRIDGARSVGDVWFYQLSYPTDAGRQSPCGVDAAGAPVEAIALEGRWDTRQGVPGAGGWVDDPNAFSFACRGASVAKCVEMGYEPWSSAGGVSLRDHHQACVRMLRADYCGDGTSWTIDGTLINLYDGLGIQTDAMNWTIEAEWTAAGARSVSKESHTRIKMKKGEAPACLSGIVLPDAGKVAHFSTGTLLMSEYKK